MNIRSLACCALLLSMSTAAVTAQYIAYPLDSLHGVRGQIIPLGSSTSSNFDEGRSQILIPARFLPSPGGSVVGIEVAPHVTGSVNYVRLAMSMGHTTASSLTTTFATNLPSPTLVYGQTNFIVNYPSRTTWETFMFATAFNYDGTSNVVIEIQKELDGNLPKSTVSHQTSFAPDRTDLPSPLVAFSAGGGGAYTAITGSIFGASSRLMVRLLFQNNATLTIEGTRGGTSQDYFALGTTATVRMRGNTGDSYVLAFDVGLGLGPVPIPSVNGLFYLGFPNVLLSGAPTVGGVGTVPVPIPNAAPLVGTQFYFQAGRIDGASPPNVDLTNIVDAIVGA